jgi:hypothetical protein
VVPSFALALDWFWMKMPKSSPDLAESMSGIESEGWLFSDAEKPMTAKSIAGLFATL